MLIKIVSAWEKYKGKIQYGCLDIFIFMVGSGIIDALYSDHKGLAIFGGLVAVFGITPIVDIIYAKSKEVTVEP